MICTLQYIYTVSLYDLYWILHYYYGKLLGTTIANSGQEWLIRFGATEYYSLFERVNNLLKLCNEEMIRDLLRLTVGW